MDKFLGMPIWPRPLTDAEHIARLRKDDQRRQRLGKWLVLAIAAVGVLLIYFVGKVIDALWWLLPPGNQLVQGIALGAVIGLILAGAAAHVGHLIGLAIRTFTGDRTTVLLLKYHDMLMEMGYLDENSQAIVQEDVLPPEQ
jgi:hypothetical protein